MKKEGLNLDKREVVGSIFRGLVTGGSWIRLAYWAKSVNGRRITPSLVYVDGMANWTLSLTGPDGATVFEGSGETLEAVTIEAVAKLGKDWG